MRLRVATRWSLLVRRYVTTFHSCGVLPQIAERLRQQGMEQLTEIQQKSLHPVLEGRHAVVNAETGSGKTLSWDEAAELTRRQSPTKGFLLPILQSFTRLKIADTKIPSPYSVVLVPSPDLANQINDVYKSLAEPEWGSSVVYGGSHLLLRPNTHLVIGTPTCITQYNIQKIFRDVQILCADEVDVLLSGSERKSTWDILKIMRGLYQQEKIRDTAEGVNERTTAELSDSKLPFRQLIFTAATLPAGGRKTVHSLLQQWLPRETQFITTEQTHQTIHSAQTVFIDIHDHDTAQQDDKIVTVSAPKVRQLLKDLARLREESDKDLTKILVFANTVAGAEAIYNSLTERGRKLESPHQRPVQEFPSKPVESPGQQVESPGQQVELSSDRWWEGKIGQLHKKIPPHVRQKILQRFKTGELQVLVSTDLASRGLDLPNVTAVIQFDFPVNSANYLHRAGRTARAGKSGMVISYVGNSDQDLAAEIKGVLEDRTKTFMSIFSRNKMLRRKIKTRTAREEKDRHSHLGQQ